VWGFKGLFFVRRAETSLEWSRGFSGALRRVLWLCGGQRSAPGAASWAAGARGGLFEQLKHFVSKSWCSPSRRRQRPRLRQQSVRLKFEEMRGLS